MAASGLIRDYSVLEILQTGVRAFYDAILEVTRSQRCMLDVLRVLKVVYWRSKGCEHYKVTIANLGDGRGVDILATLSSL